MKGFGYTPTQIQWSTAWSGWLKKNTVKLQWENGHSGNLQFLQWKGLQCIAIYTHFWYLRSTECATILLLNLSNNCQNFPRPRDCKFESRRCYNFSDRSIHMNCFTIAVQWFVATTKLIFRLLLYIILTIEVSRLNLSQPFQGFTYCRHFYVRLSMVKLYLIVYSKSFF